MHVRCNYERCPAYRATRLTNMKSLAKKAGDFSFYFLFPIFESQPAINKSVIGKIIPTVSDVASDMNPIVAGIIATPVIATRKARESAVPMFIPGVFPRIVKKPGNSGPTPDPAAKYPNKITKYASERLK